MTNYGFMAAVKVCGYFFRAKTASNADIVSCHGIIIEQLQAKKSLSYHDEVPDCRTYHDNIFRVTDPLRGEFTGYRWIPRLKASDVEFWCFLWSAPE